MRGQRISESTTRAVQAPTTGVVAASRRTAHGNAWSLPLGTSLLRQPQDGAPSLASTAQALLGSLHRRGNPLAEPDDASLTGGTRSLTRRLMGLNVTSAPRKASISAAPVTFTQRRVA
jgi:hypothetical protein